MNLFLTVLIYYITSFISLNRGGSYIDSTEWLQNKKATINTINKKDDKCFQYPVAALSHEQIRNHPERISRIKPFIDQYNWNKISFPSHKSDSNEFEKNNKTIALNVLFVPYNTKQIRPAYVSKYTSSRENQVVLLMITYIKKQHYLAEKSMRIS